MSSLQTAQAVAVSTEIDGFEIRMPVCKRFWAYALVIDDGGDAPLVSVYRTTWLEDDNHRWLTPVHDLIRDAEIVDRSIVDDPEMVFGEAERTLYRVAA